MVQLQNQQIFIISYSTLRMVDRQKPLANFKTIIVGNTSVGKSTILLRYLTGQFTTQNTTLAVDYKFKPVTVQDKTFNLELWDTAGQQRYKTIVYSFFKLSKAACIVFDLTSHKSLEDVESWMDQLAVHCGNEIPKILLGNKCDILDPHDLKQELERIRPRIQKLQQQYGCQFFPVSAKNGENIDKAFGYLAAKIADSIIQDAPQPAPERVTFKLEDPYLNGKGKKKKDKCCS